MSYLYLGNTTAQANKNNATEKIVLYSKGTKGHIIVPSTTALTSGHVTHYLPNTTGWIATGGDGTSTGVGDTNTPVYLGTSGVLSAISTS